MRPRSIPAWARMRRRRYCASFSGSGGEKVTASDFAALLPYLLIVGGLYLIPLLLSRRAKRDPAFATSVVLATAVLVVLAWSILFPLAAGLVGPIEFGGYLRTIAVYVTPGLVVLAIWVGALRYLRR